MTGLFDTVAHRSEKIAELTREIAMREQVYPNGARIMTGNASVHMCIGPLA